MKRFFHLATILFFWLITNFAWAEEAAEETASSGKNYILSYFLTGLGIVLGLVVICRPGNRSKEVRPPAE